MVLVKRKRNIIGIFMHFFYIFYDLSTKEKGYIVSQQIQIISFFNVKLTTLSHYNCFLYVEHEFIRLQLKD